MDESLLDPHDKTILRLLQQDGRTSNVDLSRAVNLSPPAIHARLRRLHDLGMIQRTVALLDREKMGYDMLCFVSVKLQIHQSDLVERFREAVQHMPEVLECHHVTGEYDYLLKVVIRNRANLEQFVIRRLTPIEGIAHIHTSIVLNEIKTTTELPIP